MEYRGYEISLSENQQFSVSGPVTRDVKYTVSKTDGLVFLAESSLGRSFATTGEAALQGAKAQIDAELDS